MGTLGIFASRLNVNTKSLEAFDEALRFFKKLQKVKKTSEVEKRIEKIIDVIDPIIQNIEGNLSESIAISEQHVVDIIRDRHDKDWPTYKQKLKQLRTKLDSDDFCFTDRDIGLLNDVADAVDVECGNLFRRMSERR